MLKTNRFLRVVCLLTALSALAGCGSISKKSAKQETGSEKSEPPDSKVKPTSTPAVEDHPEDKIAKLIFQTPKSYYDLGEAIPATLTLKISDFNLKLKKFAIEDQTLLSLIEVKHEDGSLIPPSKVIAEPERQSEYFNGKPAWVQPGIELKAGEEVKVTTNNLLRYYDIKKAGKYTLQGSTVLEIYREMTEEKPRRVRELEAEIFEIQRASKIPEESKSSAITALRSEIQEALAEYKGTRQQFVVLDTYRGKAEIKSNAVEVTIN